MDEVIVSTMNEGPIQENDSDPTGGTSGNSTSDIVASQPKADKTSEETTEKSSALDDEPPSPVPKDSVNEDLQIKEEEKEDGEIEADKKTGEEKNSNEEGSSSSFAKNDRDDVKFAVPELPNSPTLQTASQTVSHIYIKVEIEEEIEEGNGDVEMKEASGQEEKKEDHQAEAPLSNGNNGKEEKTGDCSSTPIVSADSVSTDEHDLESLVEHEKNDDILDRTESTVIVEDNVPSDEVSIKLEEPEEENDLFETPATPVDMTKKTSVVDSDSSSLSKKGKSKTKAPSKKRESLSVDGKESTSESPAAPITPRRDSKLSYIMMDVKHKKVEPKDIVEYEWPLKSGDRWFLQEQIGELLGIKSFSRKYPNFSRRKVNNEEREYLERVHLVNKLLNETSLFDMNAMRSSEIQDIMQTDFPDVFKEYKQAVSQREKEVQMEKARELREIKNDAEKYQQLRDFSKKSASEFNRNLSKMRREQKGFWDIQTNIIQSPRNRWLVMKPEATKPGTYPVQILAGQFQEYYKEYTPEELRRLPLGTVTDTNYLYPPLRGVSPPPITVSEIDIIRAQKDEELKSLRESIKRATSKVGEEPLAKLRKIADDAICEACEIKGGSLIRCAICEIIYHPKCVEMPERMAKIVNTYDWSCVECRPCSICFDKEEGDDEKMVPCDWCDRSYHLQCAGLNAMPRGTWMCQTFCSSLRNQSQKSSSPGTSSKQVP